MKLLNLIALSVSASLFVAADVARASDASPERLDLDSTEGTKSHLRGLMREPAEERMASLEPLAEGVLRVAGEVPQRIESAIISAETVAENAGGLVAGRAAAPKRIGRKRPDLWRPAYRRMIKAGNNRPSGLNKRLDSYLRAVVKTELQKRLAGKAVTDLDYAQIEEEMVQEFMAKLSKKAMN